MTTTTPRATPRATPRHRRPQQTVPVLARYRKPTPPRAAEGLTARQSGEIARITARHGRTTWRRRPDGTVLLAVHGDDPAPEEHPTYLILLWDGTILRPARRRAA